MRTESISVPSISCGHCKASIEEALGSAAGVVTADADVSTKRVSVSFDPAQTTLERIKATIEDQGHEVAG